MDILKTAWMPYDVEENRHLPPDMGVAALSDRWCGLWVARSACTSGGAKDNPAAPTKSEKAGVQPAVR